MKVEVTTTVQAPADDIYRIICDMAYMFPAIDPHIISVTKETTGPIDIGTKWTEKIRVPNLPGVAVRVALELTGFVPGRSINFTFKSRVMSGTGITICTPNGSGTDMLVGLGGQANGIGRLLYPLVRRDLYQRELNRTESFKRKIESGELDASRAEPAPGIAAS